MPAICVETALGKPISRINLLRAVLVQILKWLPHLDSPKFLKTWDDLLAYRHEWVQLVSYTDSSVPYPKEGQIVGITSGGGLRLHDRDGREFILEIGEISLRPIPD
jgi:biotin-(acetyl-CoA carboxylase) ligase